MILSWRWFGEKDPISLADIAQTGAHGIVSALHYLPNGEVWPFHEIDAHQKKITTIPGLNWEVVESIPVVEEIKQGKSDRDQWIEKYQQNIRNLGKAGVSVLCYNFMPLLDWTRTHLHWPLERGGSSLMYVHKALVAFDVFLLKREGADKDYSSAQLEKAESWLAGQAAEDLNQLRNTLLAGLPGSELGFDLDSFKKAIAPYQQIDREQFQSNLSYFLDAILPIAEESGVQLAIHPDDPPFSILGLPRIVSTLSDLEWLFTHHPSPANGLTFCTGSFGAGHENDIPAMWKFAAERVAFLHLRNVITNSEGDFQESDHLGGRVNMVELIEMIVSEESRRGQQIPMRPDHGHRLLKDLDEETNPGYSLTGRLKGLAQLQGIETAITHMRSPSSTIQTSI